MNPMQAPNVGVGGKDFGNSDDCKHCKEGADIEIHHPWPKGSKAMYFHTDEKGKKTFCTKQSKII